MAVLPGTSFRSAGSTLLVSHEQQKRLQELKRAVHERLLRETEFAVLENLSSDELSQHVQRLVTVVSRQAGLTLSAQVQEQAEAEVLDDLLGYGPIQPFLEDPTVTEVMVNGAECIFVERNGRLEQTTARFLSDDHLMRIIHRIVAPLGRRIDESSPMVDARLPDGSRVNAVIPPLALQGPYVTIRKFSQNPYAPEDLVRFGTLSEDMAKFLKACVVGKLNILVSGGTGSGKTTTLNVLSSYIPSSERVVTIEDAAELQLQQVHVLPMESRPSNMEGKGEVNIRQLVRNALRMRPDRIIVGEVRGGETLDMLQAMNTGHQGSLSTVHANSTRDVLSRLETMVLMAGMDLPSRAIREQVCSAIDLVVHQARLRDGRRRIVQITEVQKMEGETITLQDIFVFNQQGVDQEGNIIGSHQATGLRPLFLERLVTEAADLPPNLFARQGRSR